ncbi:MAG: zinc ribbon domain-containing protein [Pyrinomonadaceae bacterium]|nr:zinc ribbon domain-containing protein [Pyrinomonadaceae bacterium]
MYCQQCGAEVGEANFCRRCGTPSGTTQPSTQRAAMQPPLDYEKGFKKLFMGLAFLVIAVFPIFSRGVFWWWMLFPAVPLLAAGLGEFMRARTRALPPSPRVATLSAQPGQMPPAAQAELPRARNTAEIVPQPTSVTEGTTRHLDKDRSTSD